MLVADDDEDILTLVALRLRRSGLDVILARDGEEALELIDIVSEEHVGTTVRVVLPVVDVSDLGAG